jgi:hypothetical protein
MSTEAHRPWVPNNVIFRCQRFRYRSSLLARTFRLVEILPAERSVWRLFSDPLRIRVLEYDLDSTANVPAKYEALSYTWGVAKGQLPDRVVLVETADGIRELKIHKNLWLALRSLRDNNILHYPIFADQICINQGDELEKGCQVGLMGEIYRRCDRVVVWLGPPTAGSNQYFDFATKICGESAVYNMAFKAPQERVQICDAVVNGTCAKDDEVLRVVNGLGPRFPIAGYAEVLQRPWFGRLWVIQEAALSPNGLFVSGGRHITFDTVRVTYFFYSLYTRVWNATRSKAVWAKEMRQRDDIFQLETSFMRIFGERMAIHILGRRATLYDLVKKFNVNEDGVKIGASMPEDRIFGLMGLVDESEPLPQPDYESTIRAYTNFARDVITKDIDILLFAQKGKEVEKLPSWVPDWSMGQLNVPHGYTNINSRPEKAAGGELPDKSAIPYIDGRDILHIHGLVIDRIVKVGKCQIKEVNDQSTTDSLDYHSLQAFFEEIEAFIEDARNVGGSQQAYITDEDQRLHATYCLSDGGHTAKLLASAESGSSLSLKQMYDELRRWSTYLNKTAQAVSTYTSFSRTFAAHQTTPQHWYSYLDPATSLRYMFALIDVTLAVVRVWIHLKILPWRNWLTRVPVAGAQVPAKVEDIVDLRLHRTREMHRYKVNLFRNHGRNLFLTEGGLVGLGPEDMAKDDLVVVLFGGSVPFVLRGGGEDDRQQHPDFNMGTDSRGQIEEPDQVANTGRRKFLDCQYVGEAYCHGIMEGEALNGMDEERIITFRIC